MNRKLVLILLALIVSTCSTTSAADAPPAPIQLAKDKQTEFQITVSPNASASVKGSAETLARYLTQISGAKFRLESGAGGEGIVVGKSTDFKTKYTFGTGPFQREEYVLTSTSRRLYIIGSSDFAVSNAVWDLLHRLGYRQFFPGQTWEVVPKIDDLKIAIDVDERPSFYARRIWYNWGLWGYNDEPYKQWCERNRAVKGFDLNSGHAYENILAANKAEFDKHPEYYALNNGVRRTTGGDLKFCVSNQDLRKLVAEHAVRVVEKNPAVDSISTDPSDGGNWCECEACAKMGSVSNRVLTLANDAADAINQLNLGPKYVGMYAYNKHSAPPTVRAHPKVIVSATTAFIGGGFTFDQVFDGWKAQGATLGVYDYLSVVDWDWNLPRGAAGSRPHSVAANLAKFHKQGARFYDAESGDCWGPCGLGYYVASRVMWDVREADRVDAIIEDFLDKAFAGAKEPMREFYRLIGNDTQRRSPSDLIGRMYRQLDAARKLSTDPAVQERLKDLTLYTRYAELYYALANGAGKTEDVARFAYRIRKTMMVHSYGLWARLLSQKDALTPNHPMKSDEPFTPAEIDRILSEGISKNVPVEPGFNSKEFSRKLAPAAQRLKLPNVAPGKFPGVPQDHQQYFIWMPEGAGSLDLSVTVQKVWANRMPRARLFSPLDVTLNAVAIDENVKPDGKETVVKLKTPHAGLHRVEFVDGGDHTRIKWPAGMPVTIESGIDTPNVLSHFRGDWSLYFYVPKGTKLIGGWASRVANWAPRISGKLLDPDGKVALDFAKLEDGWFKVNVENGQDGKLWKFENSHGQRLLMTVPPYLARSGGELLLPEEVVDADSK